MKSFELILKSNKKIEILNKEASKQVKGGNWELGCPPPVGNGPK